MKAAAAASLLLLTSCRPAVPVEPGPPPPSAAAAFASPSPAPTSVVVVRAVQPRTAAPSPAPGALIQAAPSPVALPLSVLAGRSGADLRVTLDRLLQEQVFLTAAAQNAGANARLDDLIGASSALDQSSIVIAEVVGAIKGQATARSFVDAWRGQQADLVQYASSHQPTALSDLETRQTAIATQLASTDLSTQQLEGLLMARSRAQLAVADALASHDALHTVQRLTMAASASDELGRPLAQSLASHASAQAPPPVDGLDVDIRLAMNLQFQQRIWLSAAASAAAADNRIADQQALTAAAADTAAQLGGQLSAVWGPDLGTSVADRLRAQTDALVGAAAGGNRSQSAADIDRLRTEIDGLLAGANPLLPPGLLAQQLRASDQQLLVGTDAYIGRDFSAAYSRVRDAARQIQKVADTLSLSIVDRFPGRYLVLPTPYPSMP